MRRRHALAGMGSMAFSLVLFATAAGAQENDADTPMPPDAAQTVDDTTAMPPVPAVATAPDPSPAATLFVRVTEPIEDDFDVPASVTHIMIRGQTLPDAVVSVDGEITAVDDQGFFAHDVLLDLGANDIDVTTSTPDGARAEDLVFIVRGD